jgi:hypothetical protein
LSDLGFDSEESGLGEITLLSAASHLAQYEEECARFQRRYGVSLEQLERGLRRQRSKESFQVEEDAMAWRFARDLVEYWRPRVEDLRRAL